ncbi:MAG: lysoplasmalogenase [Flavobacteriales bacterium]|nr:lysoplasmalogenase [Flavobacteriales bacterium]
MKNSFKGKALIGVYAIWAIIEIYLETIRWDYELIHLLFKGGLMPILMAFVVVNRAILPKNIIGFLMSALAFSWIGDLLLTQGENPNYFVFGLGAFLVAHILYAMTFTKAMQKNHELLLIKKYPMIIVLLVGASGFIFKVLFPYLDEMIVPVALYTSVITAMCLAAVARKEKTPFKSWLLVTIGALIFMFSDSLIAFNKFHEPIAWASIMIMSTYILAQALIVVGVMNHEA